MEEYRKRLRRICRASFWEGVRSVFCPSFDIPKIDLTYEGAKKSDADAMRKDWEYVGKDMRKVLDGFYSQCKKQGGSR